MNLAFYGGQTAGIVTLLALIGKRHKILYVIAQDKNLETIANLFSIPLIPISKLDDPDFIHLLEKEVDLLICCHGKKILNTPLLDRVSCINLHPCLYKYKGARPIQRLIRDKNSKASVGAHWMVEKVDQGTVISEEFITIDNISGKTEAEVYTELYQVYCVTILKTIEKVERTETL